MKSCGCGGRNITSIETFSITSIRYDRRV